VEAGAFSPVSVVIPEGLVRDLSRGLATAIGDVEASDRTDAIGAITQAAKGLFQPKAERANHAGGDDRNPREGVYSVQCVKSLHGGLTGPRFLVAFQTEALYTMSPKGENSSSEIRRLSVGIHSAAI
jgi:hypothetical protein